MNSFSKLIDGYQQFRDNLTRKHEALFKSLAAEGQNPDTLMISCSDSRVDPSLITGSRPGDLFVIRSAGNAVPCCFGDHTLSDLSQQSGELGSIQFAVEILNVKHVIVCGHTDCGAVKAMMNPESVESLKFLKGWINAALKGLDLTKDGSLHENVRRNTLNQITRLKQLDFISRAVNEARVTLHCWVFNIEEAAIESYSFDRQRWEPLSGDEPGHEVRGDHNSDLAGR